MKPFSFARAARTTGSNIVTPMQRLRVLLVSSIFLVWVGLIGVRLVWLQVVRHPEFVERAARQQQRTITVSPRRGILYDRSLRELAMTVSVDSIYAVPGEIEEARRPLVASALAKVLHTDAQDTFTAPQQILARIESSRYFTWVARKQDPSVIAQVKALGLKGVYFQKEFKRFYPENDIAAQVLGYVGTDDNGLGGVEQKFDAQLHGTQGRMLTALDARRHALASEERQPLPGDNLVLTLDANIQFMAEKALDHAMERVKPLNGTVVVQDPHTGQILALAIRPTFNPNDVRHTSTELLRDHAVSDVYEPGSTFKLVTYSAALEEKVTTPEQKIDCEGGRIVVAGRTVHDDHYNGVLTTSQALWESSDVAAIKLAERMGKDTFYKYIHGYGFGLRSGLEVPGETRGLLKPPQRWQPTTIGSVPMGQEIGVTPLQLVTMASTIANGGMYLPPHVILRSTDMAVGNPGLQPAPFHPTDQLPDPLPAGAHRVISTMTSAQMRKMMEGVVLYGTGKGMANLNGYSAGGKTGTAQKIDMRTHTYSKTKYVASFVGFAPVNNPAITIAVIIDSPTVGGHFGRLISAPVFQELAQQVLEYLGVAHDEPLESHPRSAPSRQDAVPEDLPEPTRDLNALFAEVNELPADDPLRNPAPTAALPQQQNEQTLAAAAGVPAGEEAPSLAHGVPANLRARPGSVPTPRTMAEQAPRLTAVSAGPLLAPGPVAVPSFLGASVRRVAEQAGAAGLGLQMIGSGIAREQAPAAGTLVPGGTEVVVRFRR
ncbi:MAG TPA: penicillin-binding transpeptidase domain-containing protein [Acidobacteriaceae bacterium]